jgi:hypothetical protein
MAFIPFFSRPEPNVVYIDRVVASVQIGNVDFYLTPRGIGAEKIVLDDEESDDTDDDD